MRQGRKIDSPATASPSGPLTRGALKSGDRLKGLIRFAAVGIAATLAYLLMFLALHNYGAMPAQIASAIAYMFGFVTSYIGQSAFTFKDAAKSKTTFAKFALTSFLGGVFAFAAMAISHDYLGLPAMVGALITCVFVPLLSFLVMNFWVFIQKAR